MRITILFKTLIILLIVTTIPLIILGYLSIQNAKTLGLKTADDAKIMGQSAIQDSTTSLNSLGEIIIKQKAEDVAKQMEIYIKNNPNMTVEDLQSDEYFKSIAVQPVGETGYTAITDVSTLICRFHASEKIINLDLHNLAEKLPGFWGVMLKTEGGNPAFGYYDWKEVDGSMKSKYMHIAIVDSKTADNVQFSVAATTYIEEFNKPVLITEKKIQTSINDTITTIRLETESFSTKNTILVITLITIFIVIFISILFARSLTKPLKKLTIAGNKISKGELDVEIPDIKTNDEIKDLSESFKSALAAISFLMETSNNDKK